jgi:ABC-type multidrug transport system ATPase subunit
LCDRVGIFVRGRLRTIGTPDELKSNSFDIIELLSICKKRLNSQQQQQQIARYGAFYKVTLTTNGTSAADRKAARLLQGIAPSATLIHSLAGTNDFGSSLSRALSLSLM